MPVVGCQELLVVRTRPSEPLRLVRFRPHHFFAEVGVVLFARALIITLLFSLGKNGIDVGVQR